MDERVLKNLYIFLERTAKNGLTLNEVEAMHEIISELKQIKPQNKEGVVRAND